MKAEEILEKHCPSMNNLYLDKQGRAFRDRIILAMEEYANKPNIKKCPQCGSTNIIMFTSDLDICHEGHTF